MICVPAASALIPEGATKPKPVQPKFRGLEAVSIHVLLCCSALLAIAIVAEKLGLSGLKRSIATFA